MTFTLKTKLRAISDLTGFGPTGALKSESVAGAIRMREKALVLGLNWKSDIGKAYCLT
jgi:hypothetical protein